jgi:hypothetical protein
MTGTSTALPSDLIAEIVTSAYIYAYPLNLMEMTRRVSINVADARQFGKAPMNQSANMSAFRDTTFTDVVLPNTDTLYSLVPTGANAATIITANIFIFPPPPNSLPPTSDVRRSRRRVDWYNKLEQRPAFTVRRHSKLTAMTLNNHAANG